MSVQVFAPTLAEDMEVTFKNFAYSVLGDSELSQGDTGRVAYVSDTLVRVDVVVSDRRAGSPYGIDHDDYVIMDLDEVPDLLEGFDWIDEDED